MSPQRRIGVLASLAAVLLLICAARIVYWQVGRGGELLPAWLNPFPVSVGEARGFMIDSLPQPAFQRVTAFLEGVRRGSIYDRNGQLLAEDRVDAEGNRSRFYTEPSLAHVVGTASRYDTGLSGLELAYNDSLLGVDRLDTRLGELIHQPVVGSDLVLTVDSTLQRQADRLLEGKAGAVIVMDAKSGAVLAMASRPSFDPNRVLEDGYAVGLADACAGSFTCQAPFLNRATQALYPPGSTFKTVMLIAGLDSGQLKPDQVFDFGQPLSGPGGTYYVYNVQGGGVIPDYNHKESKLTLEQSFARSANAAFAQIGDEMPPETLVKYAQRFGFSAPEGQSIPLELESSPAQLAGNLADLYSNNMLRASTAIGQGELLASPLDMGMVVLSVVNNGNLPVPYLVESVKDPSGRVVSAHPNRQTVRGLMKPETAKTVRQMMISVVQKGTGGAAAVPGLVVGGKTGTAQVGGDANPDAWFVGFAEGKDRSVVIAVAIEHGGEGSVAAAPIFAQMARAALAGQ